MLGYRYTYISILKHKWFISGDEYFGGKGHEQRSEAKAMTPSDTLDLSQADTKAGRLSATDVCALLLGLTGLIVFFLLWKGDKAAVINFAKEDGWVENLSALFWLEASVICFYRIATSLQKSKLLLYFWGIFCFFCFGEEISWGQRILHYSVQSVQGMNIQGEFNLHNIKMFNQWAGILPALKSGDLSKINLSWGTLFNTERLFFIGFFVYFLVIPLVMHSKKLKTLKEKIIYNTPSTIFLVSIWINIILYQVMANSALAKGKGDSFSETCEMLMAFAVLFYVVFYLYFDPQKELGGSQLARENPHDHPTGPPPV